MHIQVLGPVAVRTADGDVDLGRPLHRRLLAFLVANHGRSVPFETVVDSLWGERGTSMANLHAVTSRLRERLPEAAVVTERGGYRLDVAPESIDAAVFVQEIAKARATSDTAEVRALLHAALHRWRGEPYDDVPLPFAEAEAARLREMHLVAVETLAEIDLEDGAHVDVVARLSPVVAREPLRESLRACLVLALYRAGRQAEALASYDEGRHLLVEELGVDPGPALQRLHQRILEHDPDLLAVSDPVSTVAPATVPTDQTLVGRVEPLAQLHETLHRPPGPVAVAVVAGEAGIGKTTLVEAAVAHLSKPTVTAWGRCWDHAGVPPLWPWEQLLQSVAAQLAEAEVTQALHGRGAAAALLVRGEALHDAPADSPLAAARTRLYDGVAAFLQHIASRRRVVLILEDVHWADQESVALAEYVVAALTGTRLALLITLRDPAGGARQDSRDPGSDTVAALSRHRHLTRIDLQGLDVDEVRELADRHTTAAVNHAVAERLLDRTEGNPFYIEELARLFDDERGAAGRADVQVPATVRAVIEQRLRHLPDRDQNVLRVAAVIGRDLDVALVAQALDLPRFDVLGSLDQAVRAGLVTSDHANGGQRFSHALVQDALVDAWSHHRAAEVHARVARTLEDRGGDDPAQVARLAHHHLAAGPAGDPARAVTWALRAARTAQARLSLSEAERLVRSALDLLPHVTDADRTRLGEDAPPSELEVRLLLGALLTQRLGYSAPEVDRTWRECLRLAEATGSTAHVAAALWGSWHNAITSSSRGDYTAALALCATIEAGAEQTGNPTTRMLAHLTRGQTGWHRGQLHEARTHLSRAVELADDLDDDELMRVLPQHPGAQARCWLAVVTAMTGELGESDAVARATQEQCALLGHVFTTAYAEIVLALREVWLLRPVEARVLAERASSSAELHGLVELQVFALLPAAWADIALDEPSRGAARLDQLVQLSRSIDGALPFASWLIIALLAVGAAGTGNATAARAWIEQAWVVAQEQHGTQHLDLVREVDEMLQSEPAALTDRAARREVTQRLGRAMLSVLLDPAASAAAGS